MARRTVAFFLCNLVAVACGGDKGFTSSTTLTSHSSPYDDEGGGDDDGAVTGGSTAEGTGGPTTGGVSVGTGGEATTTPDPSTTAPATGDATTTPEPGTTTTGVSDGTTTNDPSNASNETTNDPSSPGTTGVDPVAECKDVRGPGVCSECVCEQCTDEWKACHDDEGCQAVRECVEETQCQGIECLNECGDVLDMYGGVDGPWVAVAMPYTECVADQCDGCA